MLPALYGKVLVGVIAVALTVVQFMPLIIGRSLPELSFLGAHVGAAMGVSFLVFSRRGRRGADDLISAPDMLFCLLSLISSGYFISQGVRVATRIASVDPVYNIDIFFGIVLILLLLEVCRRTTGLVLTGIAVLFIAYIFLGPYLPDFLSHRGLSLARFIDLQVLSAQGIFGTPISASANMVFYFILVGAFLEVSGAGKLFVDLAYCVTGRAWGGAGKASVVSSSLFGMVSGSAVANVLMSGIVTIPLMKKTGFKPTMAGAIEATASTGGQLAPPVMGAAAFILASIVGVSYADVVYAAIVPAALFYLSLLVVVDSYARRQGLRPDNSLPVSESLAGLRARWHLIPPLILMIYLLMSHFSLMLTGAITTLAVIAISWLRPATRMGWKDVFRAIVAAVRATAEVAIPSAVAGIVVGTLIQTGMALDLQRWLLDVANGSIFLSLAATMILTLMLGIGMPTAAAYLVSAILVAPALQELGIPALAAHLFVFYFAILSMVTPPVALAGYAAAGLSGANLWNTGVVAFLIALPGFLIPYVFALDQGLLLQGDPGHIARVIASAAVGIVCLSAATGGYAFGRLNLPLRVTLFCLGPLLVISETASDLIGVAGVAGVVSYQLWRFRFSKRPEFNENS